MLKLQNVLGAVATVGVFASAALGLNANGDEASLEGGVDISAEVRLDDDGSAGGSLSANTSADASASGSDDVEASDSVEANADVSASGEASIDHGSANASLDAAVSSFVSGE
ncbi:MAG: hypothetical protein WEA61_01915 [Anaerolineales bacterium]